MFFASSFYPYFFDETFYIYLIIPNNKFIISILLKLVNWEVYDFNQVISYYFIFFLFINNYLYNTDFSNIEGNYKLIVLYIDTGFGDSLNEVIYYL